ncbi:bile acid:sodium symporter family protein [Pseudarthrobacter sp. 1C304]|uniref:bile acid:sodium symporter family protein n=1 Tax=Pseudarthrobacter sp. 1C304 TaxID=3457438 RepID=UPI003FD51B65
MNAVRRLGASCRIRLSWLDPFVLLLLLTLLAAALLPPQGAVQGVLSVAGAVAIAVQFFISGLRLSTAEAVGGLRVWRLHLLIAAFSFVLFPLLGLGVAAASSWYLTPELVAGLLFLTMLPTAVQTAITFTAIARGNTAAAVCAASISNLLGIVVTPLLVALFLGSFSGMNAASAVRIVLQIVVPFMLGQLLNRRLGRWAQRRAAPLKLVDRGAILLVVYAAFGTAVANGMWDRLPRHQLAVAAGICALMLVLMLALTFFAARRMRFERADATAIMFGGSEKSLAAGLPISAILFPGPLAGVVILPVIMYHAMQLVLCAGIARRMAKRSEAAPHVAAAAPDGRKVTV